MSKKIALCGASMRAGGAFLPFLRKHSDAYEIAGLFDVDPGKMKGFELYFDVHCPCFTDFDRMCDEVHPDLVLVTTMDATHSDFVVRSMDRKISVISEKPLCINPQQCRDILAAQKRNPGIFAMPSQNARYSPAKQKLKALISGGGIGRIRSVNYLEMLDMMHGTSYFRRWNGSRKNSGGLQIHKASHHFDELQWLLESRAARVFASGAQIAYGPNASPLRGGHCHSCSLECPYRVHYEADTKSETYNLFFRFKSEDSYTPDRCVFGEDIDIEDFLSAGIEYLNGTWVNYNLIAHASYEGQTVIFEGETGRLECREELYRGCASGNDIHDSHETIRTTLTLCRYSKGEPEIIPIPVETGTHGGADDRLFKQMFSMERPQDLPTLEDGLQAVMVGAAINESLKQKKVIDVQKLLRGEEN